MGKTHVTPTMPATPPLMSLAGRLKRSTNKQMSKCKSKTNGHCQTGNTNVQTKIFIPTRNKQCERLKITWSDAETWFSWERRRCKRSEVDSLRRLGREEAGEDETITLALTKEEISLLTEERRLYRYRPWSRDHVSGYCHYVGGGTQHAYRNDHIWSSQPFIRFR